MNRPTPRTGTRSARLRVSSIQRATRAAITAGVAMLLVSALHATNSLGAAAPGDELPDGPGKALLQTRCTTCHALGELPKFRSYHRSDWRSLVVTMVDYGAKLDEREIDVLADYLVQHFGTPD